MAGGDYRSCDQCGCKAFYDANLNYESGSKQSDKTWKYPESPYRVAGVPQKYVELDNVGDWAVICGECAKTHKTVIVPVDRGEQ